MSDPVAEVAAAFASYERALIAQDYEELDRWFWNDARVVRYGINEVQYGADAVAEWRRRSPHVGHDRTLQNITMTAFGADIVVVACEFYRPDAPGLGRQSQTWWRTGGGWRIVHAHVSMVDATTVERSGGRVNEI